MLALDESFWLGICFMIFVAVIYSKARRAFLKPIDDKISSLKNQLEQLTADYEQAMNVLATANERLAQTEDECAKLLVAAEHQAKELAASRTEHLSRVLENRKNELRGTIDGHKMQAIYEVHNSILDESVKLAEKYLITHDEILPTDEQLIAKFAKLTDIKN